MSQEIVWTATHFKMKSYIMHEMCYVWLTSCVG